MRAERFEIRYVDLARRLFVLVSSASRFDDALYTVGFLRVERGGEWIILDSSRGIVVFDSRPPDVTTCPACKRPWLDHSAHQAAFSCAPKRGADQDTPPVGRGHDDTAQGPQERVSGQSPKRRPTRRAPEDVGV